MILFGIHETAIKRRLFAGVLAFSVFSSIAPVMAARLVVKIRAANPSTNQVQTVEVRASLPARVTTNDVINLAGLNLGYDVKSDSYYVYGNIQLAPREIVIREVELNDIWVIDEAEVKALEARAGQLTGLLQSTTHGKTVQDAHNAVKQGVSTILERQAENLITRVSPVRHIQAYESNRKALQEVRQQVGQIENLALASGINPGETLVGDDRSAAAPRRDVHFPVAFGEAVYKITVRNSSPTLPRRIPIRRDLPPEVTIDDILDANGLSVRFDPKEGVTAVYDDALELAALETKTFNVRIRDKWNVNGPRIDFLGNMIGELRAVIADRFNLDAVANMLAEAETRLAEVAGEKGPEEFTPAYIAFYRRQADRLDLIEQDLNRIDAALKPLETKRGFPLPAPDKKTTWLIIYAILGFLALLSLLFFLRWFVRSS